jgi:hypothetical protein
MIEARPLDRVSSPALAARNQWEDLVQELKSVSNGESASKGAEIFGSVLSNLTGEDHPRERFIGNADVGVGLVVPHSNVVRRAMLFDEVAFKDQRLDLRLDNHPLDITDLGNQAINARSMASGLLEIAANPILEGNRLSNVQDFSVRILVDVAARIARELFQLLFDKISLASNGHLLLSVYQWEGPHLPFDLVAGKPI